MLKDNPYKLVEITGEHSQILASIHAECFPYDVWSNETFSRFYKEGSWGNMVGWLSSINEDFIGFIITRQVVDTIEILSFGVLPTYQRKGIGRQLLDELLKHANYPIFLEVSIENKTAIHLYQSKGFEIMATRPNYYDKPDLKGNRDAYLMRLIP